jgi:hypothetical protein
MSDINQLNVNGKVVIEFSSNSPPPPLTPANAPVDSSAPRQSGHVSSEDLAYQLDVMANVIQMVNDFQQQRLEERRQMHERFLARILTDLEGLEKQADNIESRK